jgi:hypothetical protein
MVGEWVAPDSLNSLTFWVLHLHCSMGVVLHHLQNLPLLNCCERLGPLSGRGGATSMCRFHVLIPCAGSMCCICVLLLCAGSMCCNCLQGHQMWTKQDMAGAHFPGVCQRQCPPCHPISVSVATGQVTEHLQPMMAMSISMDNT